MPSSTLEATDRYGAMVAVHLCNRNFEMARHVIDVAETELTANPATALISRRPLVAVMEQFATENTTMHEREIAKLANCLEDGREKIDRQPIVFVGELLDATEVEMTQIPNFGQVACRYLSELMGLIGFTWPATSLHHRPLNTIVDDDVALVLQESRFMQISDLLGRDFAAELHAADWLPSEIRIVQEALERWLKTNPASN